MSSVLKPDDFKIGMFVTVKDIIEIEIDEESLLNPIQAMMTQGGQFSQKQNHLELLKGCVLRVDAINFPFIMTTVFENISQPGQVPKTYSIPLDVRDSEFMKLNEEYVSAYLGNGSFVSLLQGKLFNNIQNIDGYETSAEIFNNVMTQLKQEEERRKNEN